jgi:hypothetical protein
MRKLGKYRLIVPVAGGAVLAGVAFAQPLGEGWLLGAPDDATRFELLEDDAGGTGRTMFEMSVRFERMYMAVADGDLAIAARYWDSIEGALSRGLVRRPDRTETAEAIFLSVYDEVEAGFESGDIALARTAFMTARGACMDCHVANDLAEINEQRLFRANVFQ